MTVNDRVRVKRGHTMQHCIGLEKYDFGRIITLNVLKFP